MQRITHLHTLAQRHGLSLVESLALQVVSVFATDPDTAARFIAKILEGSPYASANCEMAVQSCIKKSWIEVSQHGTLALTNEGLAIEQKLATELESRGSPYGMD
jgi:hypothetical protein